MKRAIRYFSLSCLLLFSLLPGPAAEKPETWIEVRSPNFRIVSNASEKQARRVAEEFEQIRVIFQTALPKANVDPGQPVIILAVKNEKSLARLLPAYWETKGRAHPAGAFISGPEKSFAAVRVDVEGEEPYQVIFHEYVHLLVRLNVETIPVWLNEGFAEFYSRVRVRKNTIGIGHIDRTYVFLLHTRALLPLAVLFTADHNSPYYNEADQTSAFYAESWVVTHYLMMGDKGRNRQKLATYLGLLDRGTDPLAAAQKAFGDLKALEDAIRLYISAPMFPYATMKPPAEINDASFHLRPLHPAEQAALIGDFYLLTGRPVEARASLEEAIRLDPSLAAPRASMGLLCQRERKPDEAMKWFAEAVERDSQSFLAHYYYAIQASEGELTAERRTIVENSLLRTIELNPRFAPAYAQLARFYLADGVKLEEALTLARKAVQLEPGALTYHLVEADVLLQMGRVAEARNLARQVRVLVRSPRDETSLNELVNNITSHEAPCQEKASSRAARPAISAEGLVVHVACNEVVMDVTLESAGEQFAFHAENYHQLGFPAARWQAAEVFNPCNDLKGRQVTVKYCPVSGKSYIGNLVSLEVRR